MEYRWRTDGESSEEERCQEGFSNAETLSFLSLCLRAFALNHSERKNYFIRKNLAVSDVLSIFAVN